MDNATVQNFAVRLTQHSAAIMTTPLLKYAILQVVGNAYFMSQITI